MSKAGQRLLRGAHQALDYAEGNADPGTYRVHIPDTIESDPLDPAVEVSDAYSAIERDSLATSISGPSRIRNAERSKLDEPKMSAPGQ